MIKQKVVRQGHSLEGWGSGAAALDSSVKRGSKAEQTV